MAANSSRRLSPSAMHRTGNWILSQQVPTDLVISIGEASFPLHKFTLITKSGYIRTKILESKRSDPTQIDLSEIPGGAEAFERAAKFCYGTNFEITVHNIAALHCAAEYLEMTESMCEGNLLARTDDFLRQSALKTLSGAVTVLKACEGLGRVSEEVGLVRRCIDVISIKASNEAKFPSRSPTDWWMSNLTSLSASSLEQILTSMRNCGAVSDSTLSTIVTRYAEKSLPDLLHLHPLNSNPNASALTQPLSEEQASRLESITSLLKSTSIPLPVSFLCLLLRASLIFFNSSSTDDYESSRMVRELERLVSLDLDRATVADLLVIALDCSGERVAVANLDSVRRVVGGFVDKEAEEGGMGIFGGGGGEGSLECCSTAMHKVAKTVDAFVAEVATDEKLAVSKFVALAGLLPKSARRFDDDLYRAVDIYLKAHHGLDEIESEKVCSVIDPLRLTYEARVHASQNKRLPLQIVLHALYYDQLKLRSGSSVDGRLAAAPPPPPPLALALTAAAAPAPAPTAAARIRAGSAADVTLTKENEQLRSELTRMKLYVSDMERNNKAATKKSTFFSSVSKSIGKLINPFRHGSKDTLTIDDGESAVDLTKPRRRRFSIS